MYGRLETTKPAKGQRAEQTFTLSGGGKPTAKPGVESLKEKRLTSEHRQPGKEGAGVPRCAAAFWLTVGIP
jgi:hypothetical protein